MLDHVGIYLVIAGSYTPFMLITLHHHSSARVLLTAEWIAAVMGSIFASKRQLLSFFQCYCVSACSDLNAPTTTMVELIFFLTMGSGVLLVWPLMLQELCSAAVTLLVIGALCYLIGIVFYILGEVRPIYHTIWHLFVVAAAAMHWFAIYFFVVQTDIVYSPTKAAVADLAETIENAASMVSAAAANLTHGIME